MSTRIFVRGLPPTFTEDEFRSHFAKRSAVTDARLISHRRIGYIGFKTPEDAQAAVKYFNKSFIRMSKIGVEIAKSVADAPKPRSKARGLPQVGSDAQKLPPAAGDTKNSNNKLKRKLDVKTAEPSREPPNKKLQEFLDAMAPGKRSNTWSNADPASGLAPVAEADDGGDDEYIDLAPLPKASLPLPAPRQEAITLAVESEGVGDAEPSKEPVSDADWIRSKTSRLLDLVDDASTFLTLRDPPAEALETEMTGAEETQQSEAEVAIETISQSGRLFVRNLPYSATEGELRQHFSACGELQEVHLPIDSKSQGSKGFVYVLYKTPSDAVRAYKELDGREFQGRLLHIIPAAPKREKNRLDEYAISKLPLKKQKELKRKASAATSQFSWNSLYMNADAVISSVAHKLGISKADLLDPTSSDAAVRQAHAETHVIQETKMYFQSNGIDLKAFESRERDDRVLLIKNFPFGTKTDELLKLLADFGEVRQLLMPPTGTIAIAEFAAAPAARAAFAGLAYRRFKDGILFLEKAPKGVFTGARTSPSAVPGAIGSGIDAKISAGDLKESAAEDPATAQDVTTVFVRNLSFSTTAERFHTAFEPLRGFLWARLKTKTDPKQKPGQQQQQLSMGFGFVGFDTPEHARAAIAAMDGHALDGHKLLVKISQRKDEEADKKKKAATAAKGTKLVIKNLPFEATKNDVRSLFGKYGTLRSIRMPKKLGNRTRGFAFADFVTAREAANAIEALKDTHLLGRRLVLDYALQDAQDAEEEIERMTQKASRQSGLVTLARLKANSKSKVVLDETGAVDGDDV